MTLDELRAQIEAMTEEQRNSDVTIYLQATDEYIPVNGIEIATMNTMVLDEGHPFLTIYF
jgi:hypothetical protein